MSLLKRLESTREKFFQEIENLELSESALEYLRIRYLGRKGTIADLFSLLPNQSKDLKPELGKQLNRLKNEVVENLSSLSKKIRQQENTPLPSFDLTLPGDFIPFGSLHPIEQTMQEVKEIFKSIGFSVVYGPEVDDDYHNFEALNIPKHHPARDMQDTFYVAEDIVLRTHTSNTQIHVMEEKDPPLRVIVPGRVYRNEAVSVRSYCLFHQVEGLYVNQNVTFAELKGTLEYFIKEFFGEEVRSRFRPSFFPFTEPSAELDVECAICNGKGCRVCGHSGWSELLGCGMIHPKVFESVGYDYEKHTGFAFGMGLDRVTMAKHSIDEIRLLYENDLRFLEQF